MHLLFQLAKEREDERREAQEKEDSLKAKKKSDPNALKVYSKGVGKFLNPAIKKAARYTHTHARTHARTHACTHTRAHRIGRQRNAITIETFETTPNQEYSNQNRFRLE